MRTRLTSRRGLSLVEVTIMLFVLMLLTGVLAPSIMDFVRDAQWVKVKEDCEAIGVSVARLARDVGPCLKFNGTGPCTKTNRVDVLYSDGPDVTPADMSGDATADFYGGAATATELNWHKDDSRGDSMEHQLVDNGGGPNYPSPGDLGNDQAPGPSFGLGWRGAYLSPPIGPDPWGHRYLVNTVFLAMATDAGTSSLKNGRRADADGLVERHLLHFAGAQRPVRDRLRRQRHARRVPPRRRLHLRHLRRHAIGPRS